MQKAFVSLGAMIAATVIAGSAGAAPTAPPAPGSMQHFAHHAGAYWRGHRSMALFRQLDLTQAQRASIRDFAKAGFQQAHPEMLALRQKRAAFESAVPGTAAYQAASNDLAHAEANAALARALRRSDLRSRIYQLLTPAQRAQLATLQAQRQERRDWRRSHRQPMTSPAATS